VESPSANCEEKRLAKIRTDAPSIPDDLKCEVDHFIVSLQAIYLRQVLSLAFST
jgi:hypothetical protein